MKKRTAKTGKPHRKKVLVEFTSAKIAKIAGAGLAGKKLTTAEVRAVCASALTQARSKIKAAKAHKERKARKAAEAGTVNEAVERPENS